jgi:hypothetical protein
MNASSFYVGYPGTANVSATEKTQRIDGYATRRLQRHLPSTLN